MGDGSLNAIVRTAALCFFCIAANPVFACLTLEQPPPQNFTVVPSVGGAPLLDWEDLDYDFWGLFGYFEVFKSTLGPVNLFDFCTSLPRDTEFYYDNVQLGSTSAAATLPYHTTVITNAFDSRLNAEAELTNVDGVYSSAALPGKTYWYSVRNVSADRTMTGPLTAALPGTYEVDLPRAVTATDSQYFGEVRIFWSGSGAGTYQIRRDGDTIGTWNNVFPGGDHLARLFFIDRDADPGRQYQYCVHAEQIWSEFTRSRCDFGKAMDVPADPVDSDGDGVPDAVDEFPDDPQEWLDNDGDGFGDNQDPDDDEDGMPDSYEELNGLNPYNDEDAMLDKDMDGLTNSEEYDLGTDPNDPLSNGNNPPTAHIQYSCDRLACTFSASLSVDSDGEIVQYNWLFDDGDSRSGQEISKTFASAGMHEVTLTVVDDGFSSGSETLELDLDTTLVGVFGRGLFFGYDVVYIDTVLLNATIMADAIPGEPLGGNHISDIAFDGLAKWRATLDQNCSYFDGEIFCDAGMLEFDSNFGAKTEVGNVMAYADGVVFDPETGHYLVAGRQGVLVFNPITGTTLVSSSTSELHVYGELQAESSLIGEMGEFSLTGIDIDENCDLWGIRDSDGRLLKIDKNSGESTVKGVDPLTVIHLAISGSGQFFGIAIDVDAESSLQFFLEEIDRDSGQANRLGQISGLSYQLGEVFPSFAFRKKGCSRRSPPPLFESGFEVR